MPATVVSRLAAHPAATIERVLYARDRIEETRPANPVGFMIAAVEDRMEVPAAYLEAIKSQAQATRALFSMAARVKARREAIA